MVDTFPRPEPQFLDSQREDAMRAAAIYTLYEHALPKDAPGAWVRKAIEHGWAS